LPLYKHWRSHADLQPERLLQIQHFFEHYKDLEPGKWVKVLGWGSVDEAAKVMQASIDRFNSAKEKPHF